MENNETSVNENNIMENEQIDLVKPKKKKKKIIITLIILFVLAALACAYFILFKDKEETSQVQTSNKYTAYRLSGNSLEDFDLYFVQLENLEKNKVYSPLSIKYALEMLQEGAKGSTKDQITNITGTYKAQRYENNKNMTLANALFVKDTYKDSIKEKYITALSDNYNASVIYDSFKTPDKINSWVKENTFNLIDNIVDNTTDKDFILANALAIDMDWVNVLQQEEKTYSINFEHEDFVREISPLKYRGHSELEFNNNSMKASSVEIGAVANKYDIVSELGEEKQELTIPVDDFASMASSRDMLKDFIAACFESVFGGEEDSLYEKYFLGSYDFYELSKNDLHYLTISDSNVELFSRLGINAEDVDELWEAMQENDDIDIAMGESYRSANEVGSYDDCVSDFKGAVEKTFKKVDFSCDGEDISIEIPHDENDDPDEVAFDNCLLTGFSDSTYDNSEFFTDLADAFSDNFYEPRYGWNGFNEEQFNDELDYRLNEIIDNGGVEESLHESSTDNNVMFGYRIHNDMTDEIFVIFSDDKNSLMSNIDRAKGAITNIWDEYYDGEKVLNNLEKDGVYIASDGDYNYMHQLIVSDDDESVSLGGNEYPIKYIGRESIRF